MTQEVDTQRALAAYGLGDAHLTRLGGAENTNFRADAPDGSFVLRLHTAGRFDLPTLDAEMRWLAFLDDVDKGLAPAPVRTDGGTWVVPLGTTQDTPPWATLLSWVEGQTLDAPLSLMQASQAGALFARLHRHAEAFRPPAEFRRDTYDLAYYRGRWEALKTLLGTKHLGYDELAAIESAWGTFAALLDPMPDVPGGFGLVHGDAHPGNFLWHEGELRIIDFGRLGWGPYLLDVADCTLDMEPPERAAFLESYRRVRGLPEGFETHFRALMYLSALDNLAFLAPHPHELEFVLGALPSVLGAIRRLVAEVDTP